MAKRFELPQGSWLIVEELLENGDPTFVDELCKIHEADRLGSFAKTWYSDRRPASRRLLLEYLARPLATFRHEALVKRLFKLAEANSDDEVMGLFMVGFDRSIRRVKVKRYRYKWKTKESWVGEEIEQPQRTAMSRTENPFRTIDAKSGKPITVHKRQQLDRVRLFSVLTRHYLRRRVWRYFRLIGKHHAARYLAAISPALARYSDDDFGDGLALIDNWSLMHVLFHHSDVLAARPSGWLLAKGKSLSQLQPAPAFVQLWQQRPEPLIQLLHTTQARPVRQWAIAMLRQHHPTALDSLPIKSLILWISGDDVDLAELAAQSLAASRDLAGISIDDWLRLIESANPQVLESLCQTVMRSVSPQSLEVADVVRIACLRSIPAVRMSMRWLGSVELKSPTDCQTLLTIANAECESVRPELLLLVREKVTRSGFRDPLWVLEWLDARHRDARDAGWEWLLGDEEYRTYVSVWQRLLESPYDDVRLKLVEFLETQAVPSDQRLITANRIDPTLIRWLWATVLLNIHRGGKRKPAVVQSMVQRLQTHADDADLLLPILAVALRSVRSVEFRAGLAGVVQLFETRPELRPLLTKTFPELEISL